MNKSHLGRRRFLMQAGMLSAQASILAGVASRVLGEDRILTPEQTAGPFYPKPAIGEQEFYDADLTRKGKDSPVAEGEIVVVQGKVVDLEGNPVVDSIVEVWQACLSGRYNHPDDTNTAPIDPNFQYWARMTTDASGSYSFKTILPGKYPGRTAHIHYKIQSKDLPELVTQMYFESRMDDNRKDGVYKGIRPEQQKAVTVAFQKSKEHENLPVGQFVITLGSATNKRSTPPM